MSSGRCRTVSVVGAYWMSSMRSFAQNDLAGCRGHVAAELQLGRIALADFQIAFADLDVFREQLHTAQQVLAVLGKRLLQKDGVSGDEIRRRRRARDLPHPEFCLVFRQSIDAIAARNDIGGPMGRQRMRLAEKIEQRAVAPLRGGKPFVGRIGRDDGCRALTREPAERLAPEIDELRRQ